jgi:hypothetical protein
VWVVRVVLARGVALSGDGRQDTTMGRRVAWVGGWRGGEEGGGCKCVVNKGLA